MSSRRWMHHFLRSRAWIARVGLSRMEIHPDFATCISAGVMDVRPGHFPDRHLSYFTVIARFIQLEWWNSMVARALLRQAEQGEINALERQGCKCLSIHLVAFGLFSIEKQISH